MSNAQTLAQLVADVYTETNRPDLVAETLQAVLSSTLKMHGMEFFFKDIFPGQIVFDSASYLQTLDTQVLPFYRALSYIRKDNPSIYNAYEANPFGGLPILQGVDGRILFESQARAFLEIITPDDILDEYMTERVDVCYQAGSTIMIRSSTALQFGLIGWYRWPNMDIANAGAGYNSWIAQEYPYAIVYDAASAVLQKIGMTDAARKYDTINEKGIQVGLVASHVTNLLKSNITAKGY